MSAPMDRFFVDRQINEILNILKDQSLISVSIVGYEILDHT
jgi:hypothetical protein